MKQQLTKDAPSENIPSIVEIKRFDARKRLGGEPKKYHYHNAYQIIIIERGSAELLINSMICPVGAGMAIMLGSELAHGVNSFSDDVKVTLVHIPYPTLAWCDYIPEMNQEVDFLRKAQYGYLFHSAELCRNSISICRKLQTDSGFQRVSRLFALLRLFRQEPITAHLATNPENQPSKNQPHFHSATERTYTYLYRHFQQDIALDDVASYAGLNRSALCRTFKKQSGLTIFEFVNRLRIEKACQLLRCSELNVAQIAFQVGYNTFSHFSKQFTRTVKLSPTHYRAKISN